MTAPPSEASGPANSPGGRIVAERVPLACPGRAGCSAVVAAGGERGGSCGTRTGSSCQSNANPRTRTDGTRRHQWVSGVPCAGTTYAASYALRWRDSKQWRSGVAAFLGAGYRVSLAAVVFVAETTGRASFIVPARLAAVAAELVVGRSSVTTYQRPAAPAAAELLAGSTSATGD